MRAVWNLLLITGTLAGLTGCVAQTSQREQEEAVCREQANQVQNRINRADMAQRDTNDTPLSSNGMPGIHTGPLSEGSAYDQQVLDCLNATGDLPNR